MLRVESEKSFIASGPGKGGGCSPTFGGCGRGQIVFGMNGVKFTLTLTKAVTENIGFKQDTMFVLINTSFLIRMLFVSCDCYYKSKYMYVGKDQELIQSSTT